MITGLKINEQRKQVHQRARGIGGKDTVLDAWDKAVKNYGEREYVGKYDDQRASLHVSAEVDDKASRLASWLKEIGIEVGDVVTIEFPNWSEFTVAYVAILQAGARDCTRCPRITMTRIWPTS